ncbi:MAG: putative metallopeptidase [Candidatus Micrarchaeia archaeon]
MGIGEEGLAILGLGRRKPEWEGKSPGRRRKIGKDGISAVLGYAGVAQEGKVAKAKGEYEVEPAPDVEADVNGIVDALSYGHINGFRIICMRSKGATARAYARIWNLPHIWQKALDVGTFYIIEVLHEHYDPLPPEEKKRVLIHELLHIPKTFSGALRPHGGKVGINEKTVRQLYNIYVERKGIAAKKESALKGAEEMF